jgi:hypothetical protein
LDRHLFHVIEGGRRPADPVHKDAEAAADWLRDGESPPAPAKPRLELVVAKPPRRGRRCP